jgi:hypothetical protein
MEIRTISIFGCGWYGLPLAKELYKMGYRVKGSTTSAHKIQSIETAGAEPYLIHFENGENAYDPNFFNTDVLMISIPPKSKSPSLKDYPDKINAIASAAAKGKIKQVIFISSSSVYEDGNFIVDEDVVPNPTSEVGKTILAAEEILKQHTDFTTTIIRFSGLIGPNRNLAKHFAGKTNIANGLAPINLIHLADCLGLTKAVIAQKAFGYIYHGVTPSHPARKDFYSRACLTSGFEQPSFTDELLPWKQIESKNISRLLAYQFKVKDWMEYADNGIEP